MNRMLTKKLAMAARAHQEVLARSGSPRGQVTELANGLTQFRDATALAQELRQQHHDTRTKLDRAPNSRQRRTSLGGAR